MRVIQRNNRCDKTAIVATKPPTCRDTACRVRPQRHRSVKTATVATIPPSFPQNRRIVVQKQRRRGKTTVERTRHAVSTRTPQKSGIAISSFVPHVFCMTRRSPPDTIILLSFGFFLTSRVWGQRPTKRGYNEELQKD